MAERQGRSNGGGRRSATRRTPAAPYLHAGQRARILVLVLVLVPALVVLRPALQQLTCRPRWPQELWRVSAVEDAYGADGARK